MSTEIQKKRRRRLDACVDEHGKAGHCELELDGDLPRWALLEMHVGPARHGGWWTLGEDRAALLRESREALHASEWPAARLFDLDSKWSEALADYRSAESSRTRIGSPSRLKAPWRSLRARTRRDGTSEDGALAPGAARRSPRASYRGFVGRLRRARP